MTVIQFKTFAAVYVLYNGGPNHELDTRLTKMAEEFGGELVGSGFNLRVGVRDVRFEFRWLEAGAAFQAKVAAMPNLTISKDADWPDPLVV